MKAILAALLAAVVLQGFSMHMEGSIEHTHANGLSLNLPATMSVHKLPDGFLVEPAVGIPDRTPKQVFVTLRQSAAALPGKWSETRTKVGRQVYFRLDTEEGGSGGAHYKLTAWSLHARGHVLVTQVVQAEWPAVPDTSLAWTVIEGISNEV